MRRFWTATDVVPENGGFAVKLDGRGVRTPAKSPLVLPTQSLAQAVAAEWDAQEDTVDPARMPFTRLANSAIDKVRTQKTEVAEMLSAYGDSDLLCYRADHPDELVERQAAAWDPMLDWADHVFGARLLPRQGVMHTPQSSEALDRLSREVHALDNFALAAFHDLVTMTGSLILGLSAAQKQSEPEKLWEISRIDEIWQEEQWGKDDEASETADRKKNRVFECSFIP